MIEDNDLAFCPYCNMPYYLCVSTLSQYKDTPCCYIEGNPVCSVCLLPFTENEPQHGNIFGQPVHGKCYKIGCEALAGLAYVKKKDRRIYRSKE